MTVDLRDGCPRCGDTVLSDASENDISCTQCGAWWAAREDFENECIARDLAGTRFKNTGEKIENPVLKQELDELVTLVRNNTIDEVLNALDVSMDIRQSDMYVDAKGAFTAGLEYGVLHGMKQWVEKMRDSK